MAGDGEYKFDEGGGVAVLEDEHTSSSSDEYGLFDDYPEDVPLKEEDFAATTGSAKASDPKKPGPIVFEDELADGTGAGTGATGAATEGGDVRDVMKYDSSIMGRHPKESDVPRGGFDTEKYDVSVGATEKYWEDLDSTDYRDRGRPERILIRRLERRIQAAQGPPGSPGRDELLASINFDGATCKIEYKAETESAKAGLYITVESSTMMPGSEGAPKMVFKLAEEDNAVKAGTMALKAFDAIKDLNQKAASDPPMFGEPKGGISLCMVFPVVLFAFKKPKCSVDTNCALFKLCYKHSQGKFSEQENVFFEGAKLPGVSLKGAKLRNVEYRECTIISIKLDNADGIGVVFRKNDMSYLTAHGAKFRGDGPWRLAGLPGADSDEDVRFKWYSFFPLPTLKGEGRSMFIDNWMQCCRWGDDSHIYNSPFRWNKSPENNADLKMKCYSQEIAMRLNAMKWMPEFVAVFAIQTQFYRTMYRSEGFFTTFNSGVMKAASIDDPNPPLWNYRREFNSQSVDTYDVIQSDIPSEVRAMFGELKPSADGALFPRFITRKVKKRDSLSPGSPTNHTEEGMLIYYKDAYSMEGFRTFFKRSYNGTWVKDSDKDANIFNMSLEKDACEWWRDPSVNLN